MRDVIYTPYRSRLKGCSLQRYRTLRSLSLIYLSYEILYLLSTPYGQLTNRSNPSRIGLSRMKDKF